LLFWDFSSTNNSGSHFAVKKIVQNKGTHTKTQFLNGENDTICLKIDLEWTTFIGEAVNNDQREAQCRQKPRGFHWRHSPACCHGFIA
jgi:hypothetical protein